MTDLVTGEAVVLDLRLARLPSRTLSLAIDLALQLTALFGIFVLVGWLAGGADDAFVAAAALVSTVAVVIGYPLVFETLSRGRTLGKLALGLRVVRDDGGAIRFRHALVRALAGFFLDFWVTFGVGALISSLVSAQGKRLGDLLAGTVVVRERTPSQGGPVAGMPPPLAGWARGLDLSRLPDDLALAARQYLARARDLAPDVREAMGAAIATNVAQHVTPYAPPGTPAAAYLAAVLAERRNRETARYETARYLHPAAPPEHRGPTPTQGREDRPEPDDGSRSPFAPPS